MGRLGENRWGKSEVRVSKIYRGDERDEFSDVAVQVLLTGDVGAAHIDGDNSQVLPTDTMRNTVYGLAQEHLTDDLEGFGSVLCEHFLQRDAIESASVSIKENRWARETATGFIGGGSERRTARVVQDMSGGGSVSAGVDGLVVLKTRGSAFSGFPRDEFTILPELDDRLLATSVTADWVYQPVPADTSATWELVRSLVVDSFFGEWSASVQHQGWLMAETVLERVPEIAEITFHLPNQHHLPFDLTRFGLENEGTVFHPVSEPYGDIGLTVTR